jgi:hypothetical protein
MDLLVVDLDLNSGHRRSVWLLLVGLNSNLAERDGLFYPAGSVTQLSGRNLSWTVLPEEGSSSTDDQCRVLRRFFDVVAPSDIEVVVADREFISTVGLLRLLTHRTGQSLHTCRREAYNRMLINRLLSKLGLCAEFDRSDPRLQEVVRTGRMAV